jgi:competence protein ComEC
MNFHNMFITTPLYPSLCFTLALITGICWQGIDHTYHFYIFPGALLLTAIALHNKVHACSFNFIMMYCAAFLLGGLAYAYVTTSQRQFCTTTHNKKYDITVNVISIEPTQGSHRGYSCICKLQSMQSLDNGSLQYVSNTYILVYLNAVDHIRVGDTILVHDVHFKTPKNTHYLLYLAKEHITTSVSALKSRVELIHSPKYSIKRAVTAYMKHLNTSFRSTLPRETYYAFSSIFLGDPIAKNKESSLKKYLSYWGILHYIARSGLHLLIFVSIWLFIFKYSPLPWIMRQICILALILLYNLLSWPSIPFNRALYTIIFIKIADIFCIKTYYIPTLSLVTCLTLVTNPLALFSLDFQLSFGITYALAWLNEIRTRSRHTPSIIA